MALERPVELAILAAGSVCECAAKLVIVVGARLTLWDLRGAGTSVPPAGLLDFSGTESQTLVSIIDGMGKKAAQVMDTVQLAEQSAQSVLSAVKMAANMVELVPVELSSTSQHVVVSK